MTPREDPFDPRDLDLPMPVREIYRNIRNHTKLTENFKIEWLGAIISIFDEGILYSQKPLESKIIDAQTRLSEAMKFRIQTDNEHYDIDTENDRIITAFKNWLERKKIREELASKKLPK